jgi:16S rRNA (guanine(1405)-N(7))-methyltransferase
VAADDGVEAFVARTLSSRKYRDIAPETVRDVIAREIAHGDRGAEERARLRLHRLWADYLGGADADVAARGLEDAVAAGGDAVAEACAALLRGHHSSRERLDELEAFYRSVFAVTGIPGVLLDLACALNPLAWRWMGLDRARTRYNAYDINRRTVALVNRYFALEAIQGAAEQRDVLVSPPIERGDVALLLKMYHCLEHRRRGAGWQAVHAVPASWVVISFPTRNLASRRADIAGNYEPEIRENAAAAGWEVLAAGTPGETALAVHKEPSCCT